MEFELINYFNKDNYFIFFKLNDLHEVEKKENLHNNNVAIFLK